MASNMWELALEHMGDDWTCMQGGNEGKALTLQL